MEVICTTYQSGGKVVLDFVSMTATKNQQSKPKPARTTTSNQNQQPNSKTTTKKYNHQPTTNPNEKQKQKCAE